MSRVFRRQRPGWQFPEIVRGEGVVIAEPVIGASAGAVVPPPEYYRMVRELCDRYGILFICDEVMTGMGRTGKWFGIEHWGSGPT